MSVRAKKHFGQHFLKDEQIAQKIADSLTEAGYKNVLEIGPGMGILTKYLLKKKLTTHVVEIDRESVEYLQAHFLNLTGRIISKDFLKMNLSDYFNDKQFAIIGNFPYNISSQIVFKTLENRHLIPELTGMFQKEVARRIAEKEGNKVYGIISVITQAFYNVEYLFTVPPTVFDPPPKIDSGVIRLIRKENYDLPVKAMNLSDNLREDVIFAKRPEQLSVQEFISLTSKIEKDVI
jgi:16S rRNA (adenine1518-N6/adenine1519-N6)-dimethyltransferase